MGADERAIRDLFAAWSEATEGGDLSRLLTLMAEDIVFLTPGRPPLGREAFAAGFAAGRRQHQIACNGELEEVVVAGTVAFARGRLAVTVTPLSGAEPSRLAGYTLTVFRKEPDGRWVLARDANLLAPVPARP
jgi:uncharacterized protein (TIGR02246 family)